MPPITGFAEDFGAPSITPLAQDLGYGTVPAASGALGTTGQAAANAGMTPYSGFAGQYAPGALLNTIYDNPWYILPDVFNGISTSSPGYQYLRDFGADPLALFNIISGSNQTLDGGEGDFTNFMAQLYQNLGSVGGKGFDAADLIGRIFGADQDSTLGTILNAGDMNTQIRTLFNLLRDVSNVGMNPLAARGYQSAVARAGDQYGNAMLQQGADTTQSPTEWIAQNMPYLARR